MDTHYAEDYYLRILFNKIRVKELMSLSVQKLYVSDSLSKAAEMFLSKRVFYLPVVNKSDEVVGLLSHKYLYRTVSPRKIVTQEMEADPELIFDGDSFYSRETLNSYILNNIMKKDPFTMGPDDLLSDAVVNMAKRKISCIPVVDKKAKLCGVLSRAEIIEMLAKIITE